MIKDPYLYRSSGFAPDGEQLLLDETLFHNANGYIGVRSNFEEGYPEGVNSIRGTYINGFYDRMEMVHAEKLYGFPEEKQTMLNLPDSQGVELYLEEERFSLFEGEVLAFERTLDMRRGTTVRFVRWKSPQGRQVEVRITRMASLSILPLFTVEYQVRPLNFSGQIRLVCLHQGGVSNYSNPDDPRVAAESLRSLRVTQAAFREGTSQILAATSRSGLWVASAVRYSLNTDSHREVREEGESVSCCLQFEGRENVPVVLTKLTALCDSLRYPDCMPAALEVLDQAQEVGMEQLYRRQQEQLEKFWHSARVEIRGDALLGLSVNYNLYQLLQSVGKDPYCAIAAKGLSGEGYEGHVFWDTEMYIIPFFTLTHPELAKNLLGYRYRILEKAREQARLLGHKRGALYAWRSISGEECSGHYPSGSAQYHINSDVAYAVVNYYLLTGDREYLAREGLEILVETARLWLDVGNYAGEEFHINCVTGPDEYTCLVNNNYFTNVSAKHNLLWAVHLWRELEQEGMAGELQERLGLSSGELEEMERAALHMYLPYDEELDINPQDDSFLQKARWNKEDSVGRSPLLLHYHPLHLYRYQVCKQADTVLAHFIHEGEASPSTVRNSFAYYEEITTHDSSLSTCIFSIMAAKLGEMEKAYDYFSRSSTLDIANAHGNTGDGIHTANMGGIYMAVAFGFGGLRIKPDGLHLRPRLPDQWDAYNYRVRYRGSLLEVLCNREGAVVRLVEGEPVRLVVNDQKCLLEKELHFGHAPKEDGDEA